MFFRSATLALGILVAVQCFTVGVLAPKLSLEICRPLAEATRSFTFDGVKRVRIDNADGVIRVQQASGGKLEVQATIRAYTPSNETRPLAEAYIQRLLANHQEGDYLHMITEPGKRPDEVDLVVDYVVGVPVGIDLEVVGSNGNVWISAPCGSVRIEGNNTDIQIDSPRGPVYAKTANGRITVLGASAATELETVNGSIYANVKAGTLHASTGNGSIVAQLLDPSVNSCDLTAMNGNITLLLAEGCGGEVLAVSGRGTVSSDLPLLAAGEDRQRRRLQGRIAEGTMRASLNSLNGNIVISRSTS
jgi:hypothetical protein